ncbi:MAG: oligopeptidase A [Gammaproteobacteria bacterium]|nr:oligopeptidase A [Gammaproteobacteria bacterium]
MSNPLLNMSSLPKFTAIEPKDIEPALDQILNENRHQIEQLLQQKNDRTWENLMVPLEEVDDRLSQMWSVVSHLNSVRSTEALRAVYDACLPKLTDYATEMGQNIGLYNAIKSIAEQSMFEKLNYAQQKVIENELRDFELAGVSLSPEAQKRYGELQQLLSMLTAKFEHNLMDATQGWTKIVTDEKELKGLPELAIVGAKEAAEALEMEGYLFSLEQPSYAAVLTYADSSSFRHEMYIAYTTRSSDQGPNAGKWDNTEVMKQILIARKKLAEVLGYANYAELSLIPKMAKKPEEVIHFLNALALASVEKAREEYNELNGFVKEKYAIEKIAAWDVAYYSEKLREFRYNISQEDLRPYFPEDQVVQGLFKIVNKLFGIVIHEVQGVEVWHPDVKFFNIYGQDGELRGQFYLDLYARPNKRGGAWMDECRVRRLINSHVQTPIAYLTCNFNRPVGGDPALFTHDDVQTLFHEFGHGLHHLLTKIDYAEVSGINGVPWDAVELPSQFLENWCWEKPALDLMACHYKTGEALPQDLFDKMIRARNFHSAMQMVRQLEFAIFDFHLHMFFNEAEEQQIQRFLDEAREQVCVIPIPEFNRFQHGFSHIFSGGYAAGYYSYKWAEVLSSDAFSKFTEQGIFDEETGRSFMENILEQGGAKDPMELFIAFRGREPSVEALLKQAGIYS